VDRAAYQVVGVRRPIWAGADGFPTWHDGFPMSAPLQSAIDLAHEPAFELGRLEVRPPSLEVVAGDHREFLEPRVMQVLVLLARYRGEVVPRDELIQACWGGRVVGEDAINRCIGRLRKLARGFGGFDIETMSRVGFRLLEETTPAVTRGAKTRRYAIAALVLLLLAIAASLALWTRRDALLPNAEPRIVFKSFQPLARDAESLAFAVRLTDEVAGVLNASVVGMAPPGPIFGGNPDGDIVIGGSASREQDRLRVRAYLEDTRAKLTLWSAQFEGSVADEAVLRARVAAAVSQTAAMTLIAFEQKGVKLDPRTLALYLKAWAALKNPQFYQEGEARRGFEQVVARAPGFANGHGLLADSLVISGFGTFPELRPPDFRRARREAETAIRIDPHAGAAYDALFEIAFLEAPTDPAAAEDHLLQGLRMAPSFPYLSMRECQFLQLVGRTREALRHCERAMALGPLEPVIGWRNARALYYAGETELAERSIAQVFRLYPEHQNTRRMRFEIAAFTGSPDAALAMLRDENPVYVRGNGRAVLEQFLAARKSGDRRSIDGAVTALWEAARSRAIDPRYLALGAASLGRMDEAVRALQTPGLQANLFEPALAPLRREPRFWGLAAKGGLVRYWRTRNVWPDFCADPTLPYDCRTEAARVSGL
jgi:DNA-binding winged helix-turn-helix (wHTH) protein/TolB-like protein